MPRLNKFELAHHTENFRAIILNVEREGHTHSSTYHFECAEQVLYTLPNFIMIGAHVTRQNKIGYIWQLIEGASL